jgi:hypothetical protein
VLSGLKKGATLIAIPSLEQSLTDIQAWKRDSLPCRVFFLDSHILRISVSHTQATETLLWRDYVCERVIEIPESYDDEDDRMELQSIHCYTVL